MDIMRMSFTRGRSSLFALIFTSMLLLALAACGSDTSTGATTPTTSAHSTGGPAATATAAESALIQAISFVGQPTAKIVSGTTFEIDGKLKNGDSKQHDIYIQASLLDKTGKIIASTQEENVDNVPGGATVSFSIQGTTPQPTWNAIQLKVTKVTENVNGAGPD